MRYVLRKTLSMLLTLFVVTLVAFLAFQIIPGDPTTSMLGTAATPESVAALRAELGLDENVLLRYFHWVGNLFRGDLGSSYSYSVPVSGLLSDKIPVTAALSLLSFVLVLLLSLPMGMLMAWRGGSRFDRCMTVVNQVFMAVPPFFMGILFTFFFGLVLRIFTPADFIPHSESAGSFWGYLFFPALSIALPKAAMTAKLLRSSILSESRLDYARTAYSRGNNSGGVLRHHVLRNAVIPVVTFLALTIADIVAGSIIIEQVFVIPGIGRLLIASISNRDFPVVQAIVLLIAALVVFVNYLADMAYQLIDPRIRLK